MTEQQTLLRQVNRLPPPLVRLLCNLSEKEIAQRSGLSIMTVRRISWQSDWKQLDKVSRYLSACGVTVRVSIPSLRRVKKIMANKKGLEGIRNKGQKRTKGIRRLLKAMA